MAIGYWKSDAMKNQMVTILSDAHRRPRLLSERLGADGERVSHDLWIYPLIMCFLGHVPLLTALLYAPVSGRKSLFASKSGSLPDFIRSEPVGSVSIILFRRLCSAPFCLRVVSLSTRREYHIPPDVSRKKSCEPGKMKKEIILAPALILLYNIDGTSGC